MYHYELHREIRAELIRKAEHERLVREARKAARRAKGERRKGPVEDGPSAEAFRMAA